MTLMINSNQNNMVNFVSHEKTPVDNPNPQNHGNRGMISTEDKPLTDSVSKIGPKGDMLEVKDDGKKVENTMPEGKSFIRKSYDTVSTGSAIAKGLVYGVISGFFVGTVIAGIDMLYSGIKKFKAKEIKFIEMFNPKKTMTKLGHNMSYAGAVGILIGTVISEYMEAHKKNKK